MGGRGYIFRFVLGHQCTHPFASTLLAHKPLRSNYGGLAYVDNQKIADAPVVDFLWTQWFGKYQHMECLPNQSYMPTYKCLFFYRNWSVRASYCSNVDR